MRRARQNLIGRAKSFLALEFPIQYKTKSAFCRRVESEREISSLGLLISVMSTIGVT